MLLPGEEIISKSEETFEEKVKIFKRFCYIAPQFALAFISQNK